MDRYMIWTAALVCGYGIISPLEYMALRRALAAGGLLSWENQRRAFAFVWDGAGSAAASAVFGYPNVNALFLLQAALAAAQLATVRGGPNGFIVASFVTTWVISQRSAPGQDGADQMALLVLLALSFWVLVPTPIVHFAACAFIAAEGVASYAIAGFAKVGERGWRTGDHLAAIFSTAAYGAKPIGRILDRYRPLSAALSIGFIFFECSFVFAMLAPRPVAYAYIAMGVFFHIMNAAVMGLNTFFFTFSACYPAMLYLLKVRPW